jgi:NMD protein affecting ribosome stability and mRNA decay
MMELFTLTVCPVCDVEGLNQIWKQGDGVFLSVCSECDSLSVVDVNISWNIPLESLAEDLAVAIVHFIFGVCAAIRDRFKRAAKRAYELTSRIQ